MPRRRPTVLDGFSERFIADAARLELSRGYLWPTAVQSSLELWAGFVRDPAHRLWVHNIGCGVWECCGDPYEARELLGFVASALPRTSARELRKRLEELDSLY